MAKTQTRWAQWTQGQKFHVMTRLKGAGKGLWEAVCGGLEAQTVELRRPKDGDPPEDDQCKRCLKKLAAG